ncbi:MAG: hypothetical protein KDA89_17105, partial [Planctomycetaceae bacterium]|nr:hypothetical protein [Planctomycetaceae bacterium]
MKTLLKQPVLILAAGFLLGAAWVTVTQPKPALANTASGNDKFSMCTVPVAAVGETDAVFILDHLTGVLRGAYLNSQAGGFSHTYLRNVAADFQLNPSTPEPKYCIVSGNANVTGGRGNQPANGLVYVAELTSGTVVAYGFTKPQG